MDISPEQKTRIQQKLKDHDPSALDDIWSHYGKALYRFLVSRLCSPTEADDVMQELFIKIADRRRAVSTAKNLNAYLFRMARNEAVTHIRKHRKRQEVPLPEFGLYTKDTNEEVDTARIEQALGKINDEQREVVMLKFFESLTFEQIADALSISPNTAASRYRYGMEKLKQYFDRTGYR